jgi:hypothetical protein
LPHGLTSAASLHPAPCREEERRASGRRRGGAQARGRLSLLLPLARACARPPPLSTRAAGLAPSAHGHHRRSLGPRSGSHPRTAAVDIRLGRGLDLCPLKQRTTATAHPRRWPAVGHRRPRCRCRGRKGRGGMRSRSPARIGPLTPVSAVGGRSPGHSGLQDSPCGVDLAGATALG